MPDRSRRPSLLILVLALLALACIVSENAAGGVTVVVVTATPDPAAGAGGGGAPPDTPEAPATPTFTVVHLATPPGASGTTRYITDPESKDYAPQKKAPSGSDYFASNRFERPFTAETMDYLSDVDLKRVELKIDAPWVYVTFEFSSARAAGIGQTVYGAEFDTDKDGRGEFLAWGASPASGEWTTDGVEVWQDANNDAGGPTPQTSDAPNPNADGYEQKLFADGQGADPDLAWIRQIEGGAKVQLALKYSALGNADQFLWNGLADAGVRKHEWFDYNDHFTAVEAGSPLPAQAELYPLKGLSGFDNTCRDAYGFTPTGLEPGLCMYSGNISGTVFLDGTCDNLAAWHNGIMDPGEPGTDKGEVALGQGACPSSGYKSYAQGSDGKFVFAGIPAGTYCVSHEYTGWIEYTTPHQVTVNLPAGGDVVVNIGIDVELGCPPE
jgi:hypothetical protein